ncbi:MAG: EutN/CcmL family microcompartment protein [Planctomycetota bacterium]
MNLGTVIGTIWATQRHPSTAGLTFQLLRPESAAGQPFDRPIIAVDTVGAGVGERVFYVGAREAVIALRDVAEAPVDAAIVGIVEGIDERRSEVDK